MTGLSQPERCIERAGNANLAQDKFTIAFPFRRGQAFGAACDFDRVRVGDPEPLQELGKAYVEAVVETPYDGRVAVIFLARCIEMVDLDHPTTILLRG